MTHLRAGDRHPPIIAAIIAARTISYRQVVMLRRWFIGRAASTEADIRALLAINTATGGRNDAFTALLVEVATDFLVYQQRPTGRVSERQADWLIAALGGGIVDTGAELELLAGVLEAATEAPVRLAAFALAQVRHSAVVGEGPAALGRAHPSRTVDATDVRWIARLLKAAGGHSRRAVSRDEAEVLFDIADACQGARNDGAWSGLFVEAVSDHVRHHSQGASLDGTEAWLYTRLRRQGWPGSAAQSLRLLVAGAQADWTPSIPVLAEVA